MVCSVVGCKHSNRNSPVGLHYHTFPKNNKLKQLWIVLCGQHGNFNTKTARVCSAHFQKPSDYRPNNVDFMSNFGVSVKWHLKTDAVPSLNLPKGKCAISFVGLEKLTRI